MYEELTGKLVGCAFTVYNKMGFGYLELVYDKYFLIELRTAGLKAESQVPISVYYDTEVVGDFVAEVLVEETILVELKSVWQLAKVHEMQLANYLTATGKDVGLLINFGEEKVEFKRKVRLLKNFDRMT